MKVGMVFSTSDPETVWTALRFANTALEAGDEVEIFLLGQGVEYLEGDSERFNIVEQARIFLEYEGRIGACGKCLGLRGAAADEMRPLSNMKDLRRMVLESDRILTF
jgi:uncharacterized protein involved in oxidation of intracellular sulfur